MGKRVNVIVADYKTNSIRSHFFFAFMVLLMGLLCLSYSHELVYDPFGRVISLGLFGFWLMRLVFQFFVYSRKVWRGKKFETVMHIVFAITWMYFTCVFLISYMYLM